MPQTAAEALKQAQFLVDDDVYRLVKLHPRAITPAAGIIAEIGEPFCALLVDKDEVTLVIPEEAVNDFAHRMGEHEVGAAYRLLTIDAVLEPDLIGFMGQVSTALGAANVGVFPYSAYSRDHILIPADQIERALDTLKALQASL
jgi:hypothetical protein